MRANAPTSVILALAALSFLSAPLQARTHKKTPAKAASHSTHKARVQADAPAKKHPKSKGKAQAKPAPKAHAKAHSKSRRHRQEPVEDTSPATITRIGERKSDHQKATSSDFLQAAGTPSSTEPLGNGGVATSGPAAIHAPAHPDDPAPKPATKAASHSRSAGHANSASQAVGVVSVIRPTEERPSLPSVQEAAATPVILPSLYNKRGRLIVPPPMKGSHEILLRQNQVADRDGLNRIRDDEDILELREQHLLVALPTSSTLAVDERLPANRRYCRPWTAQFLSTLSRAYYARFGAPLQVNSAVRTVEFQQHLLRTNGNAAPAEGDTASPHLTGQAVDLAKHGLSLTQIAWLRGYLLPLVQSGKVDVEEEFQQACFHISVYKKYLPSGSTVPRRNLAATHPSETTALATAVQ